MSEIGITVRYAAPQANSSSYFPEPMIVAIDTLLVAMCASAMRTFWSVVADSCADAVSLIARYVDAHIEQHLPVVLWLFAHVSMWLAKLLYTRISTLHYWRLRVDLSEVAEVGSVFT